MKKNTLKYITLILIAIILTITVFVLFKDKKEIYKENYIDSLSYQTISLNDKTYEFKTKIETYLLMGIDGRNNDPLLGQADFLTLLIVDSNTSENKVLVIPRDTISEYLLCDASGNEISLNKSHINLAYASGGKGIYNSCINEVDAIKRLINNIPINGYIAMPLDILKDLVDIMGEKEVILEDDSLVYLDSGYKQGTIYTINKETIEEYLRFRDIEESFSAGNRTSRQMIYMKYLLSSVEDNKDLSFKDLDTILAKCSTNLTNTQLSNLYDKITTYKTDTNFIVLPGEYQMNNNVDEYIVSDSDFKNLLIDIYYE